jgi:hypothetical protein
MTVITTLSGTMMSTSGKKLSWNMVHPNAKFKHIKK